MCKWDGRPREMDLWEQDFLLRGAMQASAVPVFQQFARDIGPEKMQGFLTAFEYGNANSGINAKCNPGIAWWIGWVETGTEVYFFAFNMDVYSPEALPDRKAIPVEILIGEGVPIAE